MDECKNINPLELLLRGDLPDLRQQLPHKIVELPRLSELAGSKVCFELRGLSYAEAAQLRGDKNAALKGILAGCVSPNFRDPSLLDVTKNLAEPYDVIKARLLPGEIDELWAHINQLSGYLRQTVVEVKNA